jgi:hypothetical protein
MFKAAAASMAAADLHPDSGNLQLAGAIVIECLPDAPRRLRSLKRNTYIREHSGGLLSCNLSCVIAYAGACARMHSIAIRQTRASRQQLALTACLSSCSMAHGA